MLCHPPTRRQAILPLVLLTLVVTGCQPEGGEPPVLSLSEAKQATVSLEAQPFTPPPRSIAARHPHP